MSSGGYYPYHKFPKTKVRLFHGTSCDAVSSILKKGLAARTFLTTSEKEARLYADKKSAQTQKYLFEKLGPGYHKEIPKDPGSCIMEVVCAKHPLMWYRSDIEESIESGEINNFYTDEAIPARCVRLWRKL